MKAGMRTDLRGPVVATEFIAACARNAWARGRFGLYFWLRRLAVTAVGGEI